MSTDTIIFDGECAFCLKQIRRIQKLDSKNQFDYLPRQSEGFLEKFPEFVQYENVEGLRFIAMDRHPKIGADAVYEIYHRISPFNLLAWIYKVPLIHQLCRLAYLMISKNRKRLSKACDDGVCDIPYDQRKENS